MRYHAGMSDDSKHMSNEYKRRFVPDAPLMLDWETVVRCNLKRYRREADMTQRCLADKAGISKQHLSRIERGDSSPTLRTLLACAQVLEVHPANLFDARDIERVLCDAVLEP